MAAHVRQRHVLEVARDSAFTQHSLSEDVTDLLNLSTTGEMHSETRLLGSDGDTTIQMLGISRCQFLYIRPDQDVQFRFHGGDTQVGLAQDRAMVFNFPSAAVGGSVVQFNLQRKAGVATYVQIHAVGV